MRGVKADPELLPCPFCGSVDTGFRRIPTMTAASVSSVICYGCGAHGPQPLGVGQSKKHVVAKLWNHRTEARVG